MNSMRKRYGLATLAVTMWAASVGASAGERDSRDLSSAWWQWAVSIPAQVNPLLDANGKQCMVGQRGQTWFLAGPFGGGTASRACSVPEGVKLFFPVVNSINFDTPGVCGQIGRLSVAELRGFSAAFIDSVAQFTVSLDSKPVRSVRRIRSEVFPVALPAENIFTSPSCFVPAGVFARAVDDGYYAEIEELSVGEHTLQFTASAPGGFNLNVVYQLNIVPRDRR